MIQYIQAHYPSQAHQNLVFRMRDVRRLDYADEFDLIFSNAALHWVQDHRAILTGAYRALRKGVRLAWSFGGRGNASDVLKARFAIGQRPEWREYFQGFRNPYSFYGPEDYLPWLEEVGFVTKRLELLPKDRVPRGPEGLTDWIRTTWMPITSRVPEAKREDFIRDFVTAYFGSFPADADGKVHIRMVRLEVEATKPS